MKMKRLRLPFVLLLIVFIFLPSCGGTDSVPQKTTETPVPLESNQPILKPRIEEFLSMKEEPDEKGLLWAERDPNGTIYSPNEKFCLIDYNTWDGSSGVGVENQGYLVNWRADSNRKSRKGISYDAVNLLGGNRNTVWAEGVDGFGIGQSIYGDFHGFTSSHFKICGLYVVNGYAQNAELWRDNTRVKSLEVSHNGNPFALLSLEDTDRPQYFSIDPIVPESLKSERVGKNEILLGYDEVFTFRILDVYPGDQYDNTCITGIAFEIESSSD